MAKKDKITRVRIVGLPSKAGQKTPRILNEVDHLEAMVKEACEHLDKWRFRHRRLRDAAQLRGGVQSDRQGARACWRAAR